jgi:hypothetical protein
MAILKATRNDEVEQRDLYDRPPALRKPWTDGKVALLGNAERARKKGERTRGEFPKGSVFPWPALFLYF